MLCKYLNTKKTRCTGDKKDFLFYVYTHLSLFFLPPHHHIDSKYNLNIQHILPRTCWFVCLPICFFLLLQIKPNTQFKHPTTNMTKTTTKLPRTRSTRNLKSLKSCLRRTSSDPGAAMRPMNTFRGKRVRGKRVRFEDKPRRTPKKPTYVDSKTRERCSKTRKLSDLLHDARVREMLRGRETFAKFDKDARTGTRRERAAKVKEAREKKQREHRAARAQRLAAQRLAEQLSATHITRSVTRSNVMVSPRAKRMLEAGILMMM
mgnify:CR=1 FL=1